MRSGVGFGIGGRVDGGGCGGDGGSRGLSYRLRWLFLFVVWLGWIGSLWLFVGCGV